LKTAQKRRLLRAVLILFSLWPLVQMGLVARYGISPWKLAGWGMYSTPRIMPGVGILVRKNDGDAPAPLRAISQRVRNEAEDFGNRRLWLGTLARPDKLARAVLAEAPYREVTVLVLQPVLDVGTGMVRTEETRYEYPARGVAR